MGRNVGRIKMSRHHVYPKKCRKGRTETKDINFHEHQSWHNLVYNMSPEEALEFIAIRFLPSSLEEEILKSVKNWNSKQNK